MAVTENDIINNAAAIANLINSGTPGKEISDLTKLTTHPAATDPVHMQNNGIDVYMETQDTGIHPKEVALTLSGATTIDMSSYPFHVNFKMTLTADSTFVFSNMTAGQKMNFTIIDNGLDTGEGWTLSYSGNYHGKEIKGPLSGNIDTHTVNMASVGASSAIEPIFDFKGSVETPISLAALGTLATSTDAFKAANGFTYRYYGKRLIVTDFWAVQGTADTGASQGIVVPVVNLKTFGSITLSATDDTYVQGTVNGTNLYIDNGEYIKLNFTEGTNGDAKDLALYLVCRGA
jgi:hypothetical protein